MKNLKVARRYAKALLLIGKEDGQAEVYREELEAFSSLFKANPDLEAAISNPIYEAKGRQALLRSVVEKSGVSAVTASYLLLLFDKGRIGFLDVITSEYKEMADELKGIARASVSAATELSNETIEKIRSGLGRLTGKEVVLTVSQDPALIGGIVTKIGDLVLDGSIRTQLLNLKETLKRSEAV
ncbi:ATP synthase F1 subunit delta [Desulfatibacillum aliphaticivorans]|uniref:ATP synthase subunit delta n=1 Tax=Desulfatibacillum aliphaticivorans TaxID=218208 RepID=ATPD_DESAL|nr:ATP synthase F1 subunit delta [Desulfatibacillum aliphaticivorans]B8FGT7.1 RecName: Full=ATP synthase subunit delta; AltName: Full=ATP synthase F(1) sector subunit delta; AltName: Full=F-type ATPase subunit delta; Short=F-ATPase subunit delta [Desulfatibacillum aliphaticivorans]ACL05317.1 ATP synthase F1, delta subunit [Desulfatibacillum aliphaticivorans]